MEKFTKLELWNMYIALHNLQEDPKNKKCNFVKEDELIKTKTKLWDYIKSLH
jgi:hypothetical protein